MLLKDFREAEPPSHKYDAVQTVRQALRRKTQNVQIPVDRIATLPEDPDELKRLAPELYTALFKEGSPSKCPWPLVQLRDLQAAIPMRSTKMIQQGAKRRIGEDLVKRDMQSGDMAQLVAQTMCTFMSKFMGQQSMPSPSQAQCPTLTVLTQSPPRAALPASGASSSEALIPLSASGAPPPAPIALIPLPASGAQLPASAFETPQRRLRLFQSPEPKMGRIAAARLG